MKHKNIISVLTFCIVVFSSIASISGIHSETGQGKSSYKTIRGQVLTLYGIGLYKHMTSDVAIQGIAQDYVTLFIGIPTLLISFFWCRKNLIIGKLLLTGTVGYFLVTYMFYMCMAMYNELFLIYIILTALSFYLFILLLNSFGYNSFIFITDRKFYIRFAGGFLIFNSISIAMMWLGIIVPPLMNGTIYPTELNHYTTLIVQGLDLSILLPASFISGLFLIQQKSIGYILAPVYLIFLSILMTALTAKITGMSLVGVNPGPAIVIIPLFNSAAIILSIVLLRHIKEVSQFKG